MKLSACQIRLLFFSLSIISTASSAPATDTLDNDLSINLELFNSTEAYTGPTFFDDLINDPQIPFTEQHSNTTAIPDVTDSHTLSKRAVKRYNYLKFKVTLSGNVNYVLSLDDPGRPWYFRATSADLYIFDRIGRNARDIVLVWRDPNGGNAIPGSLYWMTNRRLFSFLKPNQWDEPVIYLDTVPTKWAGFNQLLAVEVRNPNNNNYNYRNQFTRVTSWFLSNFLPQTVRNGGVNIKWDDSTKRIWGVVDLRSLGYPYAHDLYLANIDGKFHSKGYTYL